MLSAVKPLGRGHLQKDQPKPHQNTLTGTYANLLPFADPRSRHKPGTLVEPRSKQTISISKRPIRGQALPQAPTIATVNETYMPPQERLLFIDKLLRITDCSITIYNKILWFNYEYSSTFLRQKQSTKLSPHAASECDFGSG